MKKLSTIVMACVLAPTPLLSLSACKDKEGEGAGAANVKVWTVDVNEKVLQDNTELYTDLYVNDEMCVFGAKNEKESGQIVITSLGGEAEEYTVSATDLTSLEGVKFDKENVEFFHELYLEGVSVGKEYYKTPGKFPDAILPYEAAVEYGENKVGKDNNQAIFVRFDIPEEQAAGVYTGNITVKVSQKDYVVPVELTVYNTTVSEEVHSRSAFAYSWGIGNGEFDTSLDMRNKYAEFLAEYMVSGGEILMNAPSTDEEIAVWVDTVAKLAKNPKISTVRLPKVTKTVDTIYVDEVEYNNITECLDSEYSAKMVVALAKRCIEDNVNYIKKLFIRGMDEPVVNKKTEADIIVIHETARLAIEYSKQGVEGLRTAENSAFIDELIAAIDKMPVVTTDGKVRPTEYLSYCPYYSALHTTTQREELREATYNELWWYGCNVPTNPYPNYHVDDSLLGARVLSWMQYEYDVVGNLYWGVDAWNGDAGGTVPKYDYYSSAVPAFGDAEGVLVYPGKHYGIDGPIATIRLEAIRDGLEEYELLRSMELAYKEVNEEYNTDAVMALLSNALYFGTELTYDLNAFNTSRKMLYTLSELVHGDAGFMITDVKDDDGQYTVKMFAKEGATVASNNGGALTEQAVEGGKEYTLTFSLANGITGLDVKVSVNGKSQRVSWYLGASSTLYTAENLLADIKDRKGNGAVEGNAVVEKFGLSLLQLRLDAVEEDDYQEVVIANDAIKGIGKGTKKMVITLYYDGAEDTTQYITLRFKYSGKAQRVQKLQPALKPGLNKIEISNMYAYDWDTFGHIDKLYIGFNEDEKANGAITNVYLKDIAIFDN